MCECLSLPDILKSRLYDLSFICENYDESRNKIRIWYYSLSENQNKVGKRFILLWKEPGKNYKFSSLKVTSTIFLQEHLRSEQQDVQQQRELLYRKLEALKAQGIILSPTLTVLTTTPPTHTVHEEHLAGMVLFFNLKSWYFCPFILFLLSIISTCLLDE